MRSRRRARFYIIALLAAAFLLCPGCTTSSTPVPDLIPEGTGETLSSYPDPDRFEASIQAFEDSDEESAPPSNAVVVAGSSSIVIWQLTTIHQDLAPLTIIPRGFGGSTLHDLLYFADRIILPHSPRALVIYEGENDIAFFIDPADVILKFRETIAYLHDAMPDLRIYLLSAKLSPSREYVKSELLELNSYMKLLCDTDERLTFIDITTPMLNSEGEPDPSLFGSDMLHMNPSGYVLWKAAIFPVLSTAELPYE